jgi:hypothetical protein
LSQSAINAAKQCVIKPTGTLTTPAIRTSELLSKASTMPTRALTTSSTGWNSEQMRSDYGWWKQIKNSSTALWIASLFAGGGAIITGSASAEEESPFDKIATEDLLNNLSKSVEKLQKAKYEYIMAKGLLDFGKNIDVNAKDRHFTSAGSGNTPLHYAVLLGDQYLVENLIRNGANVNIGNDIGNTPLILAAKEQNLIIVKILLENGADANVRGIADFTAVDYLDHYSSNTEIGRLLKKRTTVESALSQIRSPRPHGAKE